MIDDTLLFRFPQNLLAFLTISFAIDHRMAGELKTATTLPECFGRAFHPTCPLNPKVVIHWLVEFPAFLHVYETPRRLQHLHHRFPKLSHRLCFGACYYFSSAYRRDTPFPAFLARPVALLFPSSSLPRLSCSIGTR